jgi:hypothetical protein
MAVTAATANNNQMIDGTGGICYDPANQGPADAIAVRCRSTSGNSILVNVGGVHASGEFTEIEVGKEGYWKAGPLQLGQVFIKGNGGNAIVAWDVFVRRGT